MLLVLLCGAPHAGKSSWLEKFTSRHENSRIKIIDIYHVQHQFVIETEEDIWNAYLACAQEIETTLQNHHGDWDAVVFEAPLIGKQERAMFSHVMSENKQENDCLMLVWCETDEPTLRKRLSVHSDGTTYDIDGIAAAIERPINQEGCDCIAYFTNSGISEDTYLDLAKIHCGYEGKESVEAREIIRKFESGENKDNSYSRGLVYVLDRSSLEN